MAPFSSRFCRKMKHLSSSFSARTVTHAFHPETHEGFTVDSRFLLHSAPKPKIYDHSHILLFPQIHISTLPNGIRVATQTYPVSATRTASIGIWIDAGSRFETQKTNGTAHFLEHMIFKGTHRRTANSLEEEIENMGAHLNAYTSREQTTFYADVQHGDVPVAIDILADILQNSRFPDHAIRRERSVILREMEEVQGQMEEVIFDHLYSAAFRGHPLGNTILGPEENIQSISKADLHQYISTHYTGPRMVISAAGAVKHEDIVGQVSKLFNRLSIDSTTADQLVEENPATFTASEVRVENENMPLVHFAIAFKGVSWTDPYSIPLMVIQCLLGTWNKGIGNYPSGELAYHVSTGNLAESIMAFNTNYCDTGLLGIYFTAMPDRLQDLSLVVMQEMKRLAYQVSEDELIRARNKLKASLLLHIDGCSSAAENNGRQMLTYGRVIPFLELFTRIDAVDSDTIKEVAKNFILDKARFLLGLLAVGFPILLRAKAF